MKSEVLKRREAMLRGAGLVEDGPFGMYLLARPEGSFEPRLEVFTVFTKMADTPRGEYEEEIDVKARNKAEAKLIAEKALSVDYDEGLSVAKVVGPRVGLFF